METTTEMLPTVKLFQAGQSPWLDYLSREMLRSGSLKKLVEEQGVLGVTSNPSIFQKAISSSGGSYENDLRRLVKAGRSILEIYDALTISDIQAACDLFREVFERTQGEHGYVSLEVLPHLAYKTDTTIEEALRLWKEVNRPNVMIKVPATPEGLTAIRKLIGHGVNINVTLMFSQDHYRGVAYSYLEGLEDFQAKGGDLAKLRSVASVFVSRLDGCVDKKLQAMILETKSREKKGELEALAGKAALSNCKLIYQEFKRIFNSDRFLSLQRQGAHVQKVLWGSTSTKNPSYPGLLYVESLVGMDTVNTMPQETLDALLDHGRVSENTVEEGVEQAHETVRALEGLGFDLLKIGEMLQVQGVQSFCDSFDSLMKTLEVSRWRVLKKGRPLLPRDSFRLPAKDLAAIDRKVKAFEKTNALKRFFAHDSSLWKREPEHQKVIANRLGWIQSYEWILGKCYRLDELVEDVRNEKIQDVVLLGMGGSSLASEVMSLICDLKPKFPRFHVLDTTDPGAISKLQKSLNLQKTLFMVSSKSGSTIETTSQHLYFYEQVGKAYGKKASPVQTGKHFIAITDEGSLLQRAAKEKYFRECFINPSDIGGRFSALSYFGMVSAALMGADYRALIQRAARLYEAASKASSLRENPAFYLGLVLAHFARQGRDKLTLILSQSLTPFGAWLEQVVAESTGKEKKGILPVDGEQPVEAAAYGQDRVFVAVRLAKEKKLDAFRSRLKALRKAGFPVIEIVWPDRSAFGSEILRWEMATAAACMPLGINPFDEPNVKESKEITAELLTVLKTRKKLRIPKQLLRAGAPLRLQGLEKKIRKGSYVALLVYAARSAKAAGAFQKISRLLQQKFKVPVLIGFGPRYLHSIGQFYKGGTPSGIFFEFITQDAGDFDVPGTRYSFGQLKHAQAFGDYEAIRKKGLPIVAVDLGRDLESGVKKFEKQLEKALISSSKEMSRRR